ncbi:E3 ubiquitin-protein ligase TRIM21-like [Enoplosus armatus]|uniref:E3 ubiquitin-protein ligase TRIM21-like n=1 Tax=Enoplosus armatus TaxID=215367 RepID=UPI0039942EC5
MSAANYLLTEEQLLCCICLEVFTDPVTLPCGHNFCKSCISQHLNYNSSQRQCPMCKECVNRKYKLRVNTVLSDMAVQYRQSAGRKTSSSSEQDALKEEYEAKKTELRKAEAKLQQEILERQLKNQEIEHSVKLSKEAADRERADAVQVFTALIESLERAMAELISMIEEKQKTTEKQAEGFIQELEQEIFELMRSRAELEQLSRSKDHLHFLRSFPSLNADPPTKDWTEVIICPASYGGILRTAMEKAWVQLKEMIRNEMKNLDEAELTSIQQSAVDVTLDPDTAHPELVLSDDGKQVHHGDVLQDLPYNSKRFELQLVLGKQHFSCGIFHYNVEVKGKTGWMFGVAKESINKKTEIELNPENGIWGICMHTSEYFALANQLVPIPVNSPPETVEVFVDYEEGRVSFYDVDAEDLLYSFTGCSFTEKLFPIFSPGLNNDGRNSAPLIISPVNHYAVN